MRLTELPLDRAARITQVDGAEHPVMLRLMEMGLVRGSSVRVRKRAPFSGPLELVVEGYLLSIRAHEAGRLVVDPDPAPPVAAPDHVPLEPRAEEAA